MSESTIEFLKWFVAVPGAIAVCFTLPLIIQKYRLECKKLKLEIDVLKFGDVAHLKEMVSTEGKRPGRFFELFAFYWAIPCYGVVAVLIPIAAAIGSKWLAGVAIGFSFILFISGSVVEERYNFLTNSGRQSTSNT